MIIRDVSSVWLIVGLGNPGLTYRYTRHNIGFRVIDRLSREFSIPVTKRGLMATWGNGQWEDREVVLAKPQTFMNLSGEAVVRLAASFEATVGQVIVIHDDLDLNLGEIRIREKGGDGGHRGVRSIIDGLGRDEFIRVRMGISRPDRKGDEQDFVLGMFDFQERKVLQEHIEAAKKAVKTIIVEGTSVAMNRFNRRKRIRDLH